MATYTPNLNLGKPEATDAFGNFRQLFNDNMDILDNGGGGGSGGHTIVNPSGTDMPAESKLQFTGGVTVTDDSVNGKTVVDISGGGGNVYGAFIDPTRSLTSSIAFSKGTPINYTATEDCIVEIYNDSANALEYCVDGLAVYFLASGSYTMPLPLKKGQTLTSVSANSYSGAYHVYGLTQGTNGIFTPIIYSDTERVVGVWRDNKPLYAKTYHFTGGWVNDNWTDMIDLSGLNIDAFVKSDFSVSRVNNNLQYTGNGSIRPESSGQNNTISARYYNNHLQLMVNNYSDIVRLDVTILYTKTTDSAGSGNWNTDGVPTVHYSTSEQVIGTWIDGKPLYQCTWTGTKTTNAEEVVISGLVTLDTLVDSKVIFKGNTGAQIAQYFRDASDFGRCWFDNNGIHMDLGNSYPIRPVTWYITLSYTKTTD